MKKTKEISDLNQRIIAQTEIYKTSGQLLAGTAIIVGFVVTWAQFADSQNRFRFTMEHQQRQFFLSRQSEASERIQTAIEYIGSEDETVRTGGILSLQKIGSEFPDEFGHITKNLILAFTKKRASKSEFDKNHKTENSWPPQDIQAALKAMFQLFPQNVRSATPMRSIFLIDAQLENFKLSYFNFSKAKLDSADLRGANLSHAIFKGASLRYANLEGATLTNANLDDADLTGAILKSAILINAKLKNAKLNDATLSKAKLINANLAKADLNGSILLSTNFKNANLNGTILKYSHLLTAPQVKNARGNKETQLPDTLAKPELWN